MVECEAIGDDTALPYSAFNLDSPICPRTSTPHRQLRGTLSFPIDYLLRTPRFERC